MYSNQSLNFGEKCFFYLWVLFYIYSMMNGILFDSGSFITVAFNLIMILYLLFYALVNNEFWSNFKLLFLFAFLLFILILLSSTNLPYSFKNYIKYLEGLLCFPLAFKIFRNQESVDKLLWLFKAFLGLFIVNYILANVYGFGGSYSDAAGTDVGNMYENGLYLNVCTVCLMPLLINTVKHKKLFIGSLTFALVITIVFLKRTPIAALILVGLIYAYYNYYFKKKYGIIKIKRTYGTLTRLSRVVGFGVFLSILIVVFHNAFLAQIQARSSRWVKGAMQKEARVQELSSIYDDIVNSDNPKTFFFGKETFNVVGTYGKKHNLEKEISMMTLVLYSMVQVSLVFVGIY